MCHWHTAHLNPSMIPGVTDDVLPSADLVEQFHRSTVSRFRIYRCFETRPLFCAYLAVPFVQPLFLTLGGLLWVLYIEVCVYGLWAVALRRGYYASWLAYAYPCPLPPTRNLFRSR